MTLRAQLWHVRDRLADFLLPKHREDVFARIYEHNLWGEPASRSGAGSTSNATRNISRELPALWTQYGIRSLIDAPCGDCSWMSRIAPALESYLGIDIVPQLIADNQRRYPNLRFRRADLTRDVLPAADAIHCRDCFQHLPTHLIRSALKNFEASGAQWLFLTTNAGVPSYQDAVIGGFRAINFQEPPFNFPPPATQIAEDGSGRVLALWDLRQGLASRFKPRQAIESRP